MRAWTRSPVRLSRQRGRRRGRERGWRGPGPEWRRGWCTSERAESGGGRGTARLVSAGRRDWVEAVWAEAPEVPPGLRRLAWRAGGARLIAREALMRRGIGSAMLFAVVVVVVVVVVGGGGRGLGGLARLVGQL